jgi:LysM repeat protein
VNLLKNFLVVAILAAVAGGVYIAITSSPPTKPPPGAEELTGPPTVENGTMSGSTLPAGTPSTGTQGGEAPPYRPGQAAGPETLVAVVPPPRDPGAVQTSHIEPVPGDPRNLLPGPPQLNGPPAPEQLAPPNAHAAFVNFMTAVQRKLGQGSPAGLLDAHRVLSQFYDSPGLTAEDNQQLLDTLNHVAGTVIYSREPFLEPLYVVQPGETLVQIAERCRVPWPLLAKINGLPDPEHLQPGQPLKVVRGPFGAVIHLGRCQLTLLLNDRFAGQFRISIGTAPSPYQIPGMEPPLAEGSCHVVEKSSQQTLSTNGMAPLDPLDRRIVLSNRWTIQAARPQFIGGADGEHFASIGLRPEDMDAAWDILIPASASAAGSQVVVQR